MRGDPCIVLCSVQISDYEDAIKTREDSGLKLDLLADLLELVVPAVDRISSCQDSSAGVEPCGDSGLSNADSLLLHRLVNGNTVLRLHLIELVDANNAAIGKDQSSSFDLKLSSCCVFGDAGSQSCS